MSVSQWPGLVHLESYKQTHLCVCVRVTPAASQMFGLCRVERGEANGSRNVLVVVVVHSIHIDRMRHPPGHRRQYEAMA